MSSCECHYIKNPFYNLYINKYTEKRYYIIKSININSCIKAKMLLVRATKKQRSAPMLCLSFKALQIAGVHWKNALDMPSMKRCPVVLAYLQTSPTRVSPRKQASRCMYRGLNTLWHEIARGGCNERKSTCVRFKYSNSLLMLELMMTMRRTWRQF